MSDSPTNSGAISKARRLLLNFSKPRSRSGNGRSGRSDDDSSGRRKQRYSDSWDLSRHPKPKQLKPSTQQAVERMLDILKDNERIHNNQLRELKSLVETCSVEEPICSVLDKKGYDIVQRAVIRNSYDFLDILLKKGYKVGTIKRTCSSPLHLACKFGHTDILRLLLIHNVDVTFRSTACFPSCHYVFYNSPGSVHCTTTCHSKYTPLQIALIYDRDEVVRILLQHDASAKRVDTSNILNEACQRGAEKCLAFLLKMFPNQITRRDSADQNLLSVAFNKSERCGRLILESGLKWPEHDMLNCSTKQASLLHVVYRSHSIDKPCQITKLAFEAGFKKKFLNVKDRAGNTPLHLLLRQVGKRTAIPTYVPVSERRDMAGFQERMQEDKDNEMFECIKLIVESGARLDLVNNCGEGVLHLLLRNDFYRTLYGMSTGYYYGVLPEINRVLEYLLYRGVNANAECDQVSSPLTWAAHVLCSMEARAVEAVWPQMWCLFKVLFDYGADPNIPDEKGISIVTLMLTAVNRWMTQCADSIERAQRILRCICELLNIIFDNGFDPSEDILDLCTKQIAILCNISLTDYRYLLGVRSLLLPFILNGIDPNNLQLVIEDEDGSNIPCRLHGQFYLSRAFIIHREHRGMEDFFTLFHSTLDQDNLNHLVRKMCEILSNNFEDNTSQVTTVSMAKIREQGKKVRSLKTLSRLTVAKCMAWKLNEKAACLPLPRQLKNYVKDL